MGVQSLIGIKKAVSNLNPEHVRLASERTLRVAIHAVSPDRSRRIENFLLGDLSPERRRQSASFLIPVTGNIQAFSDLAIYDESFPAPPHAFVFREGHETELISQILKANPDIGVALARSFPPFRKPFINAVITKTCKENTLFSLATALPDVVPSLIEIPWAVAEFASDTAFLTTNQLKMAFLIAAASDREIGYREQKSEVATVVAGAFGWRAIARQVVGKIPFGGGLIAKAAVAYAGTKVVGLSLDRLYSVGYTYSREERRAVYEDALKQGKEVAGKIFSHLRPDLAAKYAEQARKRMASAMGR